MTATRAAGPSLRRRWQRFVLRTQGRLDGANADRFLPWLLALAVFAWYVAVEAAAVRSLDGGSGLGPWLQAAWRREHGGAGQPLGGQDPATASWSLVSEPILALTRVIPAEAVFTIVQAGALALGVVALWRLAREEAHLRVGATWVVITAYALAPALHRTNLSAFHPEAIALPALLWAYLHGRRGHAWRFGLLVLLILSCRADLGLSVVALGILIAVGGRRRLGITAAVVGGAWSLLAMVAIDPSLPDGALTPSSEFVARSAGPLAVIPELLGDPLAQLRDLVAEPAVLFLVVVLAPLLFLPLVSPRNMAAALPCLALAMIADTAVQRVAQRGVVDLAPAAAHVAPAMAFVFIALVFALERVGEVSVTRVNVDHRLLLALLFGATLFFLTAAPTSPYRQPWNWGSRDAVDGARLEAAALVGEERSVAVSPSTTAQVAQRPHVLELPVDPEDLTPLRILDIVESSDVVLLDTSIRNPAIDAPFWTEEDRERVLDSFARYGLGPVYDEQGILVLAEAQDGGTASG